jgi:hypothetical protein
MQLSMLERINLKKMAIVAVVSATLVIASPLFANQTHAATIRNVQGGGTGVLTCRNTGVSWNAVIQLSATKQSGKISGDWSISVAGQPTLFGNKRGSITAGQITANSFSLTGFEFADTLCNISSLPITITISGQCGTNVPIRFVAANGIEIGTFTGGVGCTT